MQDSQETVAVNAKRDVVLNLQYGISKINIPHILILIWVKNTIVMESVKK